MQTPNIDFTRFEEQIFFNTVLIENLSDGEMGTGFLLVKPVDDKLNKILLFSNKHVFFGQKDKDKPKVSKKLSFTLHKLGPDNKFSLGLTDKFQVELNRGQEGFFEESDPDIDVACINISEAFNLSHIKPYAKAIEVNRFMDFDYNEFVCGEKIVFIGYPKGFFDSKNFLPVMRSGTIASIPQVDFNGKPQILIDAQVFPDSSGSPVFKLHNGNYKFVGIISEAIASGQDYIDLKKSNHKYETKDKFPVQFIGLGILFKKETIQKLYDLT